MFRRAWSWLDHHWPSAIALLVGGGTGASYAIAASQSRSPIVLGRLAPGTRSILYGSIATSAAALFGLVIAAIAILTTVDSARPEVKEMRALPAWRLLHITFLAAAGFLASTLLLSTLALGVDSSVDGSPELEMAVVAIAAVAFAELAIATAAFSVVILNLTRKS